MNLEIKYSHYEKNIYGIFDFPECDFNPDLQSIKGFDNLCEYAGQPAVFDMLGNFHANRLEQVESDLAEDNRINLLTLFGHLDWVVSDSEMFGSFKFACKLEGKNSSDLLKSILFKLVKSNHLETIKSKLGDQYDEWCLDIQKAIN